MGPSPCSSFSCGQRSMARHSQDNDCDNVYRKVLSAASPCSFSLSLLGLGALCSLGHLSQIRLQGGLHSCGISLGSQRTCLHSNTQLLSCPCPYLQRQP